MSTFYTCDGAVRGQCGRAHRTLGSAIVCCDRDDAACKRGGGQGSYSDRRPKRIDALGNLAPLTDADHDAWDALRMAGGAR